MTDPTRPAPRRIFVWIWVVYWAVLFTSTHIPVPDLPDIPEHSDLVVHFCGYAMLALLGAVAMIRATDRPGPKLLIWGSVFVVYGAVDEWLQGFVGRSPTIPDFFADVAGVLAGLLFWRVVIRPRSVQAWGRL